MKQLNSKVTKDYMRAHFVPIVLKKAKCQTCDHTMKDSIVNGMQICMNPYCTELLKAVEGKLRYKKQVLKCDCYLHADLKKRIQKYVGGLANITIKSQEGRKLKHYNINSQYWAFKIKANIDYGKISKK